MKIYTDSGLDKLQVSEAVRSALRALKADFINPATTPSKHSAVSFDEDMSTPATKKARLVASPTMPSMLANKSIPASKKVPGKISFYFETWTKTKRCSDGGTVTFNQLSEEVQHSTAKKVKYECNICKQSFQCTRGLSRHRSSCIAKHDKIVQAPIQALLGRLKEAKLKTPGAKLYLAKSPEYNMPKSKPTLPTASMPAAVPLNHDLPPPKHGKQNNKGSKTRRRYENAEIIGFVERAELCMSAGASLRETVLQNDWPEHFQTMLGKGVSRWRHPEKLASLYAQVRDVKLRNLKKIAYPLKSRARYPELEKQLVVISKGGGGGGG